MSHRNLLLIALFIIIFCWKFKVFETKINVRNYSAARNLKPLLKKSDFFKATLHDTRDKDDNSSISDVFITEISASSNDSIGITSSKFPCKSEASSESGLNFDKSNLDSNPEILNISSSKLKDEVDNTSIIIPKSLIELPFASKETTESYVSFDHFLNSNNTINLHSNYTKTEKMSDLVNELDMLTVSSRETLISKASNYNLRTTDDILELDMTTGRFDALKTADSLNEVNNFQDKFTNGNTSTIPNLVKSDSIKNRFDLKYSRKKGDIVQILNYIHEMYDVVQGTFVKLEEVRQLVSELKSSIDDIRVKNKSLSPVEDAAQNLFETKCTLHGNLEQHQVNLELLDVLKLNIDRGFFEVDEAMSDLAIQLTTYEELHQSNSHDTQLLKTARVKIFETMRTINSLMNNVQKDSNRFLKHIPDFKIVCS